MKFDAFVGGSYQSQALTADTERTVNWYPETLQSAGATNKTVLYPIPGVQELADTGSPSIAPGRAHFFENGREFAVIGTAFYEIDATATLTLRGFVTTPSERPATISSNGDAGSQLFITSGGDGYIFDLTANTFAAVAALAGKATMGDYLDGYFLALDADTSTLYISALNNGLSWTTGTDFAQRSFGSDPWRAMKVLNRYVWLFGETTTEAWYNTGATFPFAPHPSGVLAYGILAPDSAVIVGDAVAWLAQAKTGRRCVIMAHSFSPEIISTYPLETLLAGYKSAETAVGDSYSDAGHTFYILSFERSKTTWVFDTETKQWAERASWDEQVGSYVSWRPRFHTYAFGQHRMLDSQSGKVFWLDRQFGTDADGNPIRRLRMAPAIFNENKRIFFDFFELDLEPGLTTTISVPDQAGNEALLAEASPKAMLRCSNDGGKTWSAEQWRSAGQSGEYLKRVRWTRLGMARRRVFEVTVKTLVPWRLTGAYLDLRQGDG